MLENNYDRFKQRQPMWITREINLPPEIEEQIAQLKKEHKRQKDIDKSSLSD